MKNRPRVREATGRVEHRTDQRQTRRGGDSEDRHGDHRRDEGLHTVAAISKRETEHDVRERKHGQSHRQGLRAAHQDKEADRRGEE